VTESRNRSRVGWTKKPSGSSQLDTICIQENPVLNFLGQNWSNSLGLPALCARDVVVSKAVPRERLRLVHDMMIGGEYSEARAEQMIDDLVARARKAR